jgi:hypothetical protein
MRFTHYVALGDSMSTDEYPTCDLLQLDAVPGELVPAGAAALFYRNRDDLWPEFAGTDLATLCPGIEARIHSSGHFRPGTINPESRSTRSRRSMTPATSSSRPQRKLDPMRACLRSSDAWPNSAGSWSVG